MAREEVVEAVKVRLRITQSIATPIIRELAICNA